MAEGLVAAWRRLSFEQRAAGAGSILLVLSTFGPFSWVEAGIALLGLSVLFLLRQRGIGKDFHLPAADGTLIAVAGGWAALLIVVRLFDRPLGQNLLALACAAILVAAGARERTRAPEAASTEPEKAPDPADAPTRPLGDETPIR